MENAIILKGTRHGLLASVREDADWKEVLRELAGLMAHNAQFLKDTQLVLDFGWRELCEEQFDAIIAVLKDQGIGCNGILSTSFNTRTIAEGRGYRAIIGRLGLAQHHGRRMRRDAQQAQPEATAQTASLPCEQAGSAPVEPVATGESESVKAEDSVVMALETTLPKTAEASEAGTLTDAAAVAGDLADAEQSLKLEEGSELGPAAESSLEVPSSTFDSSDPAVANLPTVFDSSEIEGPRVFSSSQEPGLHVPHFQDEEPTLYIRKTLRSGQRVMFAGNVVLLGDLNPGAQIEADGDVIVLGQLRGSVHAGCEGDEQATVITSSLRATQLRIADRFYKAEAASRFFRKSSPTGTLRARLDGETVVVEALPAR